MKRWNTLAPRLRRALTALTWSYIGAAVAYMILTAILTVQTRSDFFGGEFTLLVMALLFPFVLLILLSVVNYIRYRLTTKYGVYLPHRKADSILSTTALCGLLTTVLSTTAFALVDLKSINPRPPAPPASVLLSVVLILSFFVGALALVVNFAVQVIAGFLQRRGNDN